MSLELISDEFLQCLASFTIGKFNQGDTLFRNHPKGENCAICLDKFVFNVEQEVVRLPYCDHVFHADCIIDWLQIRKSCPICRNEMPLQFPPFKQLLWAWRWPQLLACWKRRLNPETYEKTFHLVQVQIESYLKLYLIHVEDEQIQLNEQIKSVTCEIDRLLEAVNWERQEAAADLSQKPPDVMETVNTEIERLSADLNRKPPDVSSGTCETKSGAQVAEADLMEEQHERQLTSS